MIGKPWILQVEDDETYQHLFHRCGSKAYICSKSWFISFVFVFVFAYVAMIQERNQCRVLMMFN